MSELDALDPVPEQVKLQSGTVVVLEDLRARQFFKLLRIITHGALPILRDTELLRLDNIEDPADFTARLLSVMLLAIPDAETETLEFLLAMVKPYGLIENRPLDKSDTERNAALWNALRTDLDNPELDDLVTLVEAIIKRESADIQALGKRLAAMFKLAEKTGQLNPKSSTPTSSADSPSPSTSSPASTGGPTRKSRTSPSADSGNALPPSDDAATSRPTGLTSG